MLKYLFGVAALCVSDVLMAQLQLVPLDNNPQLIQYIEQQRAQHPHAQYRNQVVCPTTTLSLPFFDDFSRVDSFYPACSHWQDNHAYINQDMAYFPPTVGVATLDGLSPQGQPYNQLASTSISSPADTLTSQPINLAGRTAADKIYLSYYYQPQGLGDRPEASDSLFLEFKNSAGAWQSIQTYPGIAPTISTQVLFPFTQAFVHIADTSYLHGDFQFRFRNYASVTGNNDHWHIDYVYINANRDTTGGVAYTDVAFSLPPVSPLSRYTAMPYRHFIDTMLNDTMAMYCHNLSNVSGTLDRAYQVEDINSGAVLLNTPIPALTYAPSPNANDTTSGTFINSFAPFAPADTTTLHSVYTIINPTDFQNNPLFANSDTVHRYTKLNNYYAYDDGTAETRLIAQGIGTEVAIQFQSTVDDTLRGIYFHLPYFTNRNAELDYVNIKVWLGDLNNEVFSRDIYRLRYVLGFNGMYYFELADFADSLTPIFIPANTTFYVGWQQASTTPVPIGFDRSSDAREYTFYYTNGAWTNFDIKGAALVRPLLSMSPNYPITSAEKLPSTPNALAWSVFPNPTREYLQIDWKTTSQRPERIFIYNQLGQCVLQQTYNLNINVATLPVGIYTIQIATNGGQTTTQRFVKYD